MADSTIAAGDAPTKRTLVLGWFKQEQFWQGVGASTISTGVVAIAVMLAAAVTGWTDWQQTSVTVLALIFILALSGLFMVPKARIWASIKSGFTLISSLLSKAHAKTKTDDGSVEFAVPVLIALVAVSGALFALLKSVGW
ncbi:hypothetical protein ABIB48_002611 [Arthrobacter sp. UYCu511]|uniref:hypothetical protein n=1 Tax=Arthrobacter sp. UYCu511 TaxID=3156337 RepID=UPI003391C8C9